MALAYGRAGYVRVDGHSALAVASPPGVTRFRAQRCGHLFIRPCIASLGATREMDDVNDVVVVMRGWEGEHDTSMDRLVSFI